MATVLAILKALRRAVGRDLGTLASIKVNNLFLFVVLLSYGALNSGLRPKSAYPFFVLLGFLLLFPLSSDPLGKIPPARLGLWPLSSGQRVGLRFASLALSPVTWIGVLVLIKTAQPLMALAFFSLAAGMQAAVTLGNHAARRDPHWNVLRHIPRFPGRLGGLVRKNVREMLSLLDPYGALLISIGGGAYRVFAAHADPEAFAILGLLVALTMSTYAQSLFGLELGSGSGMTRYRLLPLRGWDVLLERHRVSGGALRIAAAARSRTGHDVRIGRAGAGPSFFGADGVAAHALAIHRRPPVAGGRAAGNGRNGARLSGIPAWMGRLRAVRGGLPGVSSLLRAVLGVQSQLFTFGQTSLSGHFKPRQ
jgi:hypothetical protein